MELVTRVVASHGTHARRRVTLIAMSNDDAEGWGECGAPDDPGYSGETADAAENVLTERILPALCAHSRPLRATEVRAIVGAILPDAAARHPMALAAAEMAVLDLQLRLAGVGFEALIPAPKRAALAGATLSNAGSIDDIVAEAQRAVDGGYRRLKVKITPHRDSATFSESEMVVALRAALDDDIMILGDANGAYLPEDLATVIALGELGLDVIEQPFADHDTETHQRLVATGVIRVALDEGVRSATDALDAVVNHEATDVTLKPARFGYLACLDLLNAAVDHGAGVWIGGMFDTGVARWANVRLATHPAVDMPSDIGASSRYWAVDVTEPVVVDNGLVTSPGLRTAGLAGTPVA
jgi:O-succinylbenzoate synthase